MTQDSNAHVNTGQPSQHPSDMLDRTIDKVERKHCIFADLLIPGTGSPIKNGCVVIEGTKITFAGEAGDMSPLHKSLPSIRVNTIMPGMWDCHTHFLGVTSRNTTAWVSGAQDQALTGMRCARDAMLLLNSGFTSAREVGGYGVQLSHVIDEGSVPGPKIYAANQIISPTAGHVDVHSLHKPWYDDACSRGLPLYTADGVPECLKAVRMQLRARAKVIKICVSGGVSSELDHPEHQQFSEEEIRAMVEEAARSRRIVAAHCHGKLGIMAALRSGVRTIEHGSFLDEEAVDLMIEKGAILVPTRSVVENGLAIEGLCPPFAYRKLLKVAGYHWQSLQLAIKKGVKIATGTDICGTSLEIEAISFGNSGKELVYLVKAGMTPLQTIEAATFNAAQTLGPQAPRAGLLSEGYDADVIALDENPLDDIEIIAQAKHVTHVWKQGKCFKSPGNPLSIL